MHIQVLAHPTILHAARYVLRAVPYLESPRRTVDLVRSFSFQTCENLFWMAVLSNHPGIHGFRF